ncbi:MAG: hypothetical protein ACI4UE_03295 [Candidatus Scatovivens sp.]
MNIERNKKTFKYLFTLFVKMGERKLGRKLTPEEINQLEPIISKKCEKIDKKDIVREIYNLELSNNEKKYGHLGIRQKLELMNQIANRTHCSVKFTSSSDDLVNAVASKFSRIQLSDESKNNLLTIRPPKVSKQEHLNLKNSYINDTFHYKAPLSVSDKMKRWVALGLVGASAIGIMGHQIISNRPQSPSKEETTISQVSQPQILTAEDYLLKCVEPSPLKNYNPSLNHFKNVFRNEFNKMNNSALSVGLEIKSRPHTFIYKLTDKNGNEFYVTKGNSPGTTESLLKKAGYTCTGIDDYDNDVNVISIITDTGDFIAACAKVNGEIVPICADGTQFTNHAPTQQELNSGYSNIINDNSVNDSKLLADLYSTRAFYYAYNDNKEEYVDCLINYIEKHPDSYLAKEVNSAIQDYNNQNVQSEKTDSELANSDEEIEL